MPDYLYPMNRLLTTIGQEKQARLVADRLGFQLMPMVNTAAAMLEWDVKDGYKGLQNVRGVNGEPPRVKKMGSSRYRMTPGYYGEFQHIDEESMTVRAASTADNAPIDIRDLVIDAQDQLLQRRLDRIEYIIWQLLCYGTFAIADGQGQVLHTDTFSLQTFTAIISWATYATAIPYRDWGSVKLLGMGKGVRFGSSAKAYMNSTTFTTMMGNTNAQDWGGLKGTGVNAVIGVEAANTVLARNDLPQMETYDEGYTDETGTDQLYIPNNKIVVIGSRPAGQVIGEYRKTRNVNSETPDAGDYMKIIDKGETEVPRSIQVHDGHNGGPVIYYPGSIVIMNV